MAKFKFKTKRRNKFNFFKNEEELTNYEMISESHTEFFSNKKCVVEGCRKILDYQENYIKLKLKKGFIVFMGNNFIITDFEQEKIIINGFISSAEFFI